MYLTPYQNNQVVQDILFQDALNAITTSAKIEKQDEMFYDYLISVATSQDAKDVLTTIRDDERRHNSFLKQIYKDITGITIEMGNDLSFERPSSYEDGLKKALFMELDAAERYRKIRSGIPSGAYKDILFEMIIDELIHSDKYNYLMYLGNKPKAGAETSTGTVTPGGTMTGGGTTGGTTTGSTMTGGGTTGGTTTGGTMTGGITGGTTTGGTMTGGTTGGATTGSTMTGGGTTGGTTTGSTMTGGGTTGGTTTGGTMTGGTTVGTTTGSAMTGGGTTGGTTTGGTMTGGTTVGTTTGSAMTGGGTTGGTTTGSTMTGGGITGGITPGFGTIGGTGVGSTTFGNTTKGSITSGVSGTSEKALGSRALDENIEVENTFSSVIKRSMMQDRASFHVDDCVKVISPLVTRALEESTAGGNLQHLFQFYIMTGVLVGLGKKPNEALEQVENWESTSES